MASFPAWEKARRIDGWFDRRESQLLWDLCQGTWVEIGCYKGRSTTILAESGHPGYAIDTFTGFVDDSGSAPANRMRYENSYVDFLANMDGYDNVVIIKNDFRTVPYFTVPEGINLLHLDADHSYELTKRAFELYARKVERGGHVAFHDARGGYWPGVEKVVDEMNRNHWQEAGEAGLLVAFQRL